MFARDIVICCESREQVERMLEGWRFALERRGMNACCSITEYMCANERGPKRKSDVTGRRDKEGGGC